MPFRDYRCGGCNHQFEELEGLHDQPKKKCPECGKNKLERVLNRAPAYHARLSPMNPNRRRGKGR